MNLVSVNNRISDHFKPVINIQDRKGECLQNRLLHAVLILTQLTNNSFSKVLTSNVVRPTTVKDVEDSFNWRNYYTVYLSK